MNKILLIISREYLTRVKKKSFIVMTILGPILMAALIIVPVLVAKNTQKSVKVMVVDDNELFINAFKDSEKTTFRYQSGNIEKIKKEALDGGEYDVVFHILPQGSYALTSTMYFYDDPPMHLRGNVEEQMDKILFDKLLQDTFNIDIVKYNTLKNATRSSIAMVQTTPDGTEKKSFTEINRLMGIIFGFAIYMFIFMFASQVLRGVLEEKTNRIVEVLLSSVKPVQLMMGKIIGIAMLGLTQFALWVVFTLVIILGVQVANPSFFTPDSQAMGMLGQTTEIAQSGQMMENMQIPAMDKGIVEMIDAFYDISFSQIIFSFLFYFLFGYLLYAALFAAVGSAADNETDSNQFTMPITIPLILSIVLVMPMADDPNGTLAWWMSMIPFTSPIAMLVRLPSGVPLWELILSMSLLVAFFFLCIGLATKIYRTGILMYGKKITYKELWKWIRYKS